MSKFDDPYAHLNIAIGPDDIVTRRLKFPTIKANLNVDPGDPTVSKDLTINVETKTWVRIFLPTKLPSNDNIVARLPIIVYFHHGGWVLFGADDSYTHKECSRIASNIPAIVISVNYRLAPENRLPAQYHDAMDAICWVKNQATNPKGEQWLRDYGDFSRCYLYGCGNGGNMVFFVGIKVCALQLEPMNIAGMIMNQPLFGGEERTKSELNYATDEIFPLPALDLMWDLALPKGVDRNHWYCNPMMVMGPHKGMISRLQKCLVMGSYGDPTVDRQQEFVTMLATCGAHVKTWFDDVGSPNAHLRDSRRATLLLSILQEFILGC
ncbi:probable carboxylesterase 9 [Juglans microcarpa x Juglans regia]|uniref:probable carboxylesterase 9 n=1 Tax=Juglans microcarpa x Juglans regia TaxID=2249226 RepID=UPI001B7E5EA3|nr:probable carboxylesterase 9 [Juglans microcarpa x Juglans regia]